MAAAAVLAAGALAGCTSSTPTLHRTVYSLEVGDQVELAFQKLEATLPPEDGGLHGPVTCGEDLATCEQKVTGGTLWWSSGAGTTAVLGAIYDEWEASGTASGPLGRPLGEAACTDAGCHQSFTGGTLVSSASGVVLLHQAFLAAWEAAGAESGSWGLPTAPAECGADGVCTQAFASGLGVAGPGSVALVDQGIGAYWEGLGGAAGALGLPTGGLECGFAAGACRQSFAGGWVYTSPGGGTHWLLPQFVDAWTAAGADAGPWGLPTGEGSCTPSGTTCRQAFGGGEVTWRADVGILDCRVQHCVALTFDDGPGADTPRLLDILDQSGAQATFFVLGNRVAGNEGVLQRADGEFHDVGVHAMTHTPLVDLDAAAQQADWSDAVALVSGALGHPVHYGRPPYGLHDANTDATAAAAGLELRWWDVDSLDWSLLNSQAVIDLVMGTVESGDVILMHDVHATTVDAIAPLIDRLRAAGYTPVSLSELAGARAPG